MINKCYDDAASVDLVEVAAEIKCFLIPFDF